MATTPYNILISPKAVAQLGELSVKQQKYLIRLIEALAVNPRPPGSKKINGMHGLYSDSIEQFRLIYKIEDQEVLLLLIK